MPRPRRAILEIPQDLAQLLELVDLRRRFRPIDDDPAFRPFAPTVKPSQHCLSRLPGWSHRCIVVGNVQPLALCARPKIRRAGPGLRRWSGIEKGRPKAAKISPRRRPKSRERAMPSCHAIATGWVVNSLGEKNRHKAGAVSPLTKDCRGRPAPARGTRPYRWRGGRVSSGWTLPRRAADQGRRVRRFSRRVRSPLTLNDEDCRQRPLEERREALSRLVAGIDGVVFSEAIEADGAIVFAKACEMGLEGIVSKRVGSRYWSGPNRQWLKVKNPEFPRATSVRAR